MILFGSAGRTALILFGLYRNFQAGWSIRYSLSPDRSSTAGQFGLAARLHGGAVADEQARRPAWLVDQSRRRRPDGVHEHICNRSCVRPSSTGMVWTHRPRFAVGQLAVAAASWMLQPRGPVLRHFSHGPLEWLWRSLTYGIRSLPPRS